MTVAGALSWPFRLGLPFGGFHSLVLFLFLFNKSLDKPFPFSHFETKRFPVTHA